MALEPFRFAAFAFVDPLFKYEETGGCSSRILKYLFSKDRLLYITTWGAYTNLLSHIAIRTCSI